MNEGKSDFFVFYEKKSHYAQNGLYQTFWGPKSRFSSCFPNLNATVFDFKDILLRWGKWEVFPQNQHMKLSVNLFITFF